MNEIVRVEHVAKRFGKTQVLADVSFSLASGVTVLLGENGQGKSTLLRLLLGLLRAEGGTLRVRCSSRRWRSRRSSCCSTSASPASIRSRAATCWRASWPSWPSTRSRRWP